MKKIAIYPGSFDPFTNGHKSILQRACQIFDLVIVAVAVDNHKQSTFTPSERAALIQAAIRDMPRARVEIFEGLLANYVLQKNAQAIIRGLRVVADFEYEMQLAAFHKQLCPSAETIFLTSETGSCFINSTFVRNIAALGGDVGPFVPENVATALRKKYARSDA